MTSPAISSASAQDDGGLFMEYGASRFRDRVFVFYFHMMFAWVWWIMWIVMVMLMVMVMDVFVIVRLMLMLMTIAICYHCIVTGKPLVLPDFVGNHVHMS